MTARFTDKVALVTEGGSGTGRATALAFAREGATVVVTGREPGDLRRTVELIEADGGTADAVIADVTHGMDVIRLMKTVVERHGGLHIAFNNACFVGNPKPLVEMCEAVWGENLASNLTGVWLLMKHEISHMRENGGGVIINNSTNISFMEGRVGFGAYAASKAALSALTKTAAQEHIGDGIRINAISPGDVAAPASRVAVAAPSGQMAEDDEIASAVVWLAGDESQFVVGHDLVLDGAVAV
ncbi:SDR family NAD(P)-dependent oxidoreductase [Streptomyces sp. NPDC102467]|uniref:SDR family NAD(P)-dependent oxidoreductase n=1 Tax=Streptomyces sp. NPDC102467 TaxID=3366179 RepID=UPI0038088780